MKFTKSVQKRSVDGLLDTYNYRLGLSATPERYLDHIGTKKISDFFGKVVFKFGLDESIRQGYLTPYSLFPHIVYMTDDEADKYHAYSKRIAIEASKKHSDQELIKNLSIYRSNIVKGAKNKIDEFQEILKKNNVQDSLPGILCARTT